MVFKEMRRHVLVTALRDHGCRSVRNKGNHEIFGCPCGRHRAPVPRHTKISPGVVNSIEKQLGCLPKGWLT